jgi:hypothetical protein
VSTIGTLIHYIARGCTRKKTELVWKRNFEYHVWEDYVEDPDGFSLAELGVWFIAKQRGS